MTVFLFTDIEGSTRLWEEHTDEMASVLGQHDAIMFDQIEAHHGRVVKHMGDGVFAAFEGGEPLACVLEIQKRIGQETWGGL